MYDNFTNVMKMEINFVFDEEAMVTAHVANIGYVRSYNLASS